MCADVVTLANTRCATFTAGSPRSRIRLVVVDMSPSRGLELGVQRKLGKVLDDVLKRLIVVLPHLVTEVVTGESPLA